MHPEYDSKKMFHDLALIRLKEPVLPVKEVNDGAGPYWELVDPDQYNWAESTPIIRIQRYQSPSGCTSLTQDEAKDITTLLVIGHGTTSSGGDLSGKLLAADVHYVMNSVCEKQYSEFKYPISDDMICASDTTEKQDACQGDCGGPLFTLE